MFNLQLFRIRPFLAGNVAGLFASIGRGGLQFMLIIWLQGIWLPLHGFSFESHAAVGRHLHDPAHGRAARRRRRSPGSSRTATAPAASPPAGCCSPRVTFLLLMLLPANFSYWAFAVLIFLNGVGMGVFVAAEHDRHHELGAGRPTGPGLGHESHLPEHRAWCCRSASSSA